MSDLISRQEAIEAISYSEIAFYPGDNEGDCLRRDSDIKQAIMELPSAQPERKTGRWIDYIGKDLGIEGQWLRNDGKTVFVQCNQCDSLFVRNLMIHANYCPNCGCRMMEVEHEAD